MREHKASGREGLALASELLQRARLADPHGGIWEAADVQWWWRQRRASDDVEQPFWLGAQGPVAGVLMTSWRDDRWQCDPIVLPSVADIDPGLVWTRAHDLVSTHARGAIEVNPRDDDATFTGMVTDAGLIAGTQWTIAWMAPQDRSNPRSPADGFTIVDRASRGDTPHAMISRNGPEVAERLLQCPLYDAELDLSVETNDGRSAGYSLYWFDPVTRVGMVEPMRVEDTFQRHGLATAMLLDGINRLVRRGAERLKISFVTEAASAFYQSVGFRPTATVTTYESRA